MENSADLSAFVSRLVTHDGAPSTLPILAHLPPKHESLCGPFTLKPVISQLIAVHSWKILLYVRDIGCKTALGEQLILIMETIKFA